MFPIAQRGYITQAEYVAMVTKINKALISGLTHDEAVKLAKVRGVQRRRPAGPAHTPVSLYMVGGVCLGDW